MPSEEKYKNRDWLYDQLVIQEKTIAQLSQESGYSTHQLHDWSQKKFKLNIKRIKWDVSLTGRQREVIVGGLLGDGSIDKKGRYTESHAADSLDYLNWKISELRNLFKKDYSVHLKQKKCETEICGQKCRSQDQYGAATCINQYLLGMRNLTKIELIDMLTPLSFAILCLDDGSNHYYSGVKKTHSQWTIGICSFSEDEASHLAKIINDKLQVQGVWEYSKDKGKIDIRLRFNAHESEKINRIILQNIPNDLDIVKRKVIKNG